MNEKERAVREAELTRMFIAYADPPDAQRLRVFVEETASIPLAYFRESVRSAMRLKRGGFAPGIGDIFAAAEEQSRRFHEERSRRERLLAARARREEPPPTVEQLRELREEWLQQPHLPASKAIVRLYDRLIRRAEENARGDGQE